jgi:hypothetical protein
MRSSLSIVPPSPVTAAQTLATAVASRYSLSHPLSVAAAVTVVCMFCRDGNCNGGGGEFGGGFFLFPFSISLFRSLVLFLFVSFNFVVVLGC